MLRRLGLRQRIMAILAGGALFTAAIVGLSLHELSALQSYSASERVAGEERDAIHDAAIVALRAATAFSALGLDLTAEEQKQAVDESEAMLDRLAALVDQLGVAFGHGLLGGPELMVGFHQPFIAAFAHGAIARQRIGHRPADDGECQAGVCSR